MEIKELNTHALELENVVKKLNTSLETGLSEEEVKKRLEKFGFNELTQTKKISPLKIFLKQFQNFLVYLLFFAIAVSVFVGIYQISQGEEAEFLDAFVILAIIIVNAILGFYQEYRAEKAFDSLKKMAPHVAKVKRDSIIKEIRVREVVPGDVLKLDEGDKIPADARLSKAYSLNIDEAILTGESKPVHKTLDLVEKKTILADRKNMIYSNTIITRGNGEAIAVATGMNTEIGKIAEKIQEEEAGPSPFQQEIERFGKKLGTIIMIICGLVFGIEFLIIVVFEGVGFQPGEVTEIVNALTIAISLAVSAVPEGLVVVITVVMSIGMRRMATKNALVKTLTAVETLGRVNVICSDKTGTLTKNEMTVVKIFIDGKVYKVEGVGYNVIGNILDEENNSMKMNPNLQRFLNVCMFCNNSNVNVKNKETGAADVVGDPTEISLKILAMKMNLPTKAEKLDEVPFNSDRKMMSVVEKIDGKLYSLIKGAPDVLLKKATKALYNGKEVPIKDLEKIILQQNETFAKEALRVLGIAYKPLNEGYKEENIETDFTYLGLVGIIDPARDEVKDAIKEAKIAGIRTIMITGDHKITAIAIAKQIGLIEKEEAITGAELDAMSEVELSERVKSVDVFARVTSEHKLRILKSLKGQQNIVSMTGDGVNDAPAVKGAHVGVAMGLKGTEVTQEASEMILIDDNYATIVNAIEEGRGIFENCKSFIRYLLSCNFDEIVMILTAWILMKIFVNVFLAQPLEAIHILFLNLATDGLPAMVLGLTPIEPDVMKLKPRKGFNLISDIKKPILFAFLIQVILDVGLYVICWTILIPNWSNPSSSWYDAGLVHGTKIFDVYYTAKEYQIAVVQTTMFSSVVFFELFFCFSCTSEYKPMWEFRNKHLFWAVGISFLLMLLVIFTPLCLAFHTIPLYKANYWWAIILSSVFIIPIEETRKYLKRRKMNLSKRKLPLQKII